MSDIWHKPYEEKPDTDNHLVIKDFVDHTNELGYFDDEDMVFRTYTSGNVYDDEDFMEWCDIDELVAELDRTKKKLDIAVDALKKIDNTRNVIKENLYASYGKSLNSGIVFCWTTPDEIHNTLEQITAEQKDK